MISDFSPNSDGIFLIIYEDNDTNNNNNNNNPAEITLIEPPRLKTAGDIVAEKDEEVEDDEMVTLEDFLAKAGTEEEEEDCKAVVMPPRMAESCRMFGFDHQLVQSSLGPVPVPRMGEVVGMMGKARGGSILEAPLDKAAKQRQTRMMKNREAATRSRDRKEAEWTKQRYKQLMEKVVPAVEKREPQRALRRVYSTQW